MKIQKHITSIKKSRLYTVSKSFPLLSFLLHQLISLNSLDQFLSFTGNFMVASFEDIISKSAFDIMKLAYRNLKLENELRGFFINKPFFCVSFNSLNIMLEIRLRFPYIFLNFHSI